MEADGRPSPPYPSGLRLAGRRVLVVGGGHVAQRRVPALIAAGAVVEVVSPEVTPAIEGLAGAGEITWHRRDFEDADLDERVVRHRRDRRPRRQRGGHRRPPRQRRIFCVRADDATQATAWTPAVGRHDGVTVAVLGNREPRRSAALRDEILDGLRDGACPARRDRRPGVVLVGGGPGRPRAGHRRRPQGAGGRRRRGRRPAGAARAARRAAADVELIDVAKLPRGRSAPQEEINRVIVDRARAGKRVVRFKGGDNFVFGRGFEEILGVRGGRRARHRRPGAVQPDLRARAGRHPGDPPRRRPRVHRHLRPPAARTTPTRWSTGTRWPGCAAPCVLLMAVENAPAIAAALVAGGPPAGHPGGGRRRRHACPRERTVLVDARHRWPTTSRPQGVRPPAIIVVGEVVAVAHPERYGAWPPRHG